jgi:GTP pyrophosphokinase
MTFQKILSTIRKFNPQKDLSLVEKAYRFAEKAHKGQKRKSGQDYIEHSLGTAQVLAEMNLDLPTIAAGLLHDVPEETSYSLQEVEREFGQEIGSLVHGITKLGKLKYRGLERYAENLRKMFVAMAKDIRIILIKFADRLDNLKTLGALPKEKQIRIARESLEIYAPIANRLGMGELKGQLEDLSFPYILPQEYQWLKRLATSKYETRKIYIEKVKEKLQQELEKAGIKIIDIHGRLKHLYSLYQKLLKYDKDISRIHDLVALRVVVPEIKDCYAVLGVVHDLWRPLPDRFKDYIANPKPNGYQSLHTVVFCPGGEIVEIQIRTFRMHQEAEYGIASHWQYSEAGKPDSLPPARIRWLKEILEWQKEVKDNLRYLEKIKIDLFQDRIFVFTPKGDIINLPEGATPIDFAYHVHSDLGNHCVAALVNDKIAPLDRPLKNGDMVKILIDKNRKAPSRDWLDFVKTPSVRAKIRRFLKD